MDISDIMDDHIYGKLYIMDIFLIRAKLYIYRPRIIRNVLISKAISLNFFLKPSGARVGVR